MEGITIEIIRSALAAAKTGRLHILGEMGKCNPAPRLNLSKFAPFIKSCVVPKEKIGAIIGSGGVQ